MTPHTERIPVKCSQCHKDRWFAPLDPVPDPYICEMCERHNEIREGLRHSPTQSGPRPAA